MVRFIICLLALSDALVGTLKDTVQNLRTELTGFKHKTDLTISSLRARCMGRKLRCVHCQSLLVCFIHSIYLLDRKIVPLEAIPRERSPQLDTPDHTMDQTKNHHGPLYRPVPYKQMLSPAEAQKCIS